MLIRGFIKLELFLVFILNSRFFLLKYHYFNIKIFNTVVIKQKRLASASSSLKDV